MKTKAKLILAMSVLTAGVVAAGATGTFAWFTTNRAAQLTYTSVTAQKNTGNLKVWMAGENVTGEGWKGEQPAQLGDPDGIAKATDSAATKISDVSSQDGVKFMKPRWVSSSGQGMPIYDIADGTRAQDYSVFYFKVSNDGSTPLDVYLNSATKIVAASSGDTDQAKADAAAAKFTRFAINPTSLDGETVKQNPAKVEDQKTWLVENHTTAGDGKVLIKNEQGKADSKDFDAANLNNFILGGDGSKAITTIAGGTGPESQLLCTLAANSGVAYFHVSVWLEGIKEEAGVAYDTAAGGKVNITIDLAGVEHVGA